MARILVVGGTFNPVHIGHLRLAVEASEAVGCDGVVWVPGYAPRHKQSQGLLPYDMRVELLRLATAGMAGAVVSDLEKRLNTSFTVDILEALAAERPGAEFCFVLGQEQFCHMHKWVRAGRLVELADILVAARNGLDRSAFQRIVAEAWPGACPVASVGEAPPAYRFAAGHSITLLEVPRLDVSASLVRRRWLEGRDLRLLVPEGSLARLTAESDLVTRLWSAAAQ